MAHLHDLGITISVGDLDPMQLVVLRSVLSEEIAELVRRVNAETASLTGQEIDWRVSYDGSRECGAHSWNHE
jgi:hypothetical protein